MHTRTQRAHARAQRDNDVLCGVFGVIRAA